MYNSNQLGDSSEAVHSPPVELPNPVLSSPSLATPPPATEANLDPGPDSRGGHGTRHLGPSPSAPPPPGEAISSGEPTFPFPDIESVPSGFPDQALYTLTVLLKAAQELHLTTLITRGGKRSAEYNSTLNNQCRSLTPNNAPLWVHRDILSNTMVWLDRIYQIREQHWASVVNGHLAQMGFLRVSDPLAVWRQACRLADASVRGGLSTSTINQVGMKIPSRFWDLLPVPTSSPTRFPFRSHPDLPPVGLGSFRFSPPTRSRFPTTSLLTDAPSRAPVYWRIAEVNKHSPQEGGVVWSLVIHRRAMIIGDGNLNRLPTVFDNDVQIDSFPGASIFDATRILESMGAPSTSVYRVILSFGVDTDGVKTYRELQSTICRLYSTAVQKFPTAKIYLPLVSCSERLPQALRETVHLANEIIRRHCQFTPRVPDTEFFTEEDAHTWKPQTAFAIWKIWEKYLL